MKLNTRFCQPEPTFQVRQQVGSEVFEVRFTATTETDAYRMVGRWASDPEFPKFTWLVACCMCTRIRKVVEVVECGGR